MSFVPADKGELIELARKLAEAQEHMAANADEDFRHWHHRLVAEVLRALADLAQ